MKYNQLNQELFIDNRKRFVSEMKPNTLAIIQSNDEMPRNGDCFFPFRQNSDMLWLSGIDQEQTVLMLFPDHPMEEMREVLFLRRTNEHIAIWEGHKYTKEEAFSTSGIKSIYWLEDMPSIYKALMNKCEAVYVNSNENDRAITEVQTRDDRFIQSIRADYPAHTILRAAPILTKYRALKNKYEIEVMQEACDITEKAFRRVLDFVKPGVMEYEVEAEIISTFIRNRANGHAYSPIVASGGNACCLHYVDNNDECKEGDLLLMDFGSEYGNYASDLTRTIPVSGKFTDRQKDVYNSVLSVMKAATAMLVPGNNLTDYHKKVGELMTVELVKLGLLAQEEVDNQDPAKPAYKKYFMHGTSHFLGLDVHDVGDRHGEFKPGMVFTVEPGIYIPEEDMGIRIENDVLITEKEPFDLMRNIPIEVEEIETLMSK